MKRSQIRLIEPRNMSKKVFLTSRRGGGTCGEVWREGVEGGEWDGFSDWSMPGLRGFTLGSMRGGILQTIVEE